jgi:hypothetical protein
VNLRKRRDLLLRVLRLRIRSTAYLRKWIVLGAVIGVISVALGRPKVEP